MSGDEIRIVVRSTRKVSVMSLITYCAQPYMRRLKFTLNVVFFDATMVDGLISFEVNIDSPRLFFSPFDVMIFSSKAATEIISKVQACRYRLWRRGPCTPSYNGNFYYYISWSDNKPWCTVTCQWEDELSLEISHYFGEHARTFGKEEITNTSVANFFLVKMTSMKKAEELIEFDATPKQCASAVIQLLN